MSVEVWEDRAACRRPGVDPELFFPGIGETPGLALHICWSHCAVRQECHHAASRRRLTDAQVIGGVRYITAGSRTVTPERRETPRWSVGCVLCREEA